MKTSGVKKAQRGPGVAKVWPAAYAVTFTTKALDLGLFEPAQTTVPPFMSEDSATRKLMPVASGVLNYFPDALLCVAWVSRAGNDKHNPGQPLHWAKEKSTDEPDCEVRHMLDHLRGVEADPGLEPLGELGHLASKAWRALAHLQRACDAVRAKAGGK